MKNYDPFEKGFFETDREETLALPLAWKPNAQKFNLNLQRIQNSWSGNIVDFTLRKIPEKRTSGDQAKLLVVLYKDGSMFARRYNVNQHLYLNI